MNKLLLGLLLSLIALTAPARAAVLASYSFDGSVRTSSDTNLFSTASPIADGPGLTTGALFDTSRGNPAPALAIVSTEIDGANAAAAIAANDYISFTLSPSPGMVLNLTGISFDYANYTNDGTFAAEGFVARSSVDGFAANIGSSVIASVASAGAFNTSTTSLTDPAYQNLSGPIEFRIYFADAVNDSDRGALLDNIGISGNVVAVPEPATYMLMGLGLLVCTQRFRARTPSR